MELSEESRLAKLRNLCLTDLYFLLRYGLNRPDAESDWVFARCREVQAAPDGYLDLWSRGHYKSSILTNALTIQEILKDPEITVGIFSHTRPIAKGFLRQIKREFENNERLKLWFSDVLYADPRAEAPKWSEDDGILVRRSGNPKECTVEAWGLIDGQPTSKHYRLLVYDDVVTRESVTTTEQINKTTEAWELSRNLCATVSRSRYIGTRYDFSDTYKVMMDRKIVTPRVYPATIDGTVDGEPVLLTREQIAERRKEQGPYTFSAQMLMNPKADSTQGFKAEWLKTYTNANSGAGMNIYILVDAASSKKRDSDYTAISVIGLGADKNYYKLDWVRDRLSLTERGRAVMDLHRKWLPIRVGYERYGMMADIEHLKEMQERENYRFEIVELGGKVAKNDRIRRLVPIMEQGRWWLPSSHTRTDFERIPRDLVHAYIEEELKPFPFSAHDDMLDADSRILDEEMHAAWPQVQAQPMLANYRTAFGL